MMTIQYFKVKSASYIFVRGILSCLFVGFALLISSHAAALHQQFAGNSEFDFSPPQKPQFDKPEIASADIKNFSADVKDFSFNLNQELSADVKDFGKEVKEFSGDTKNFTFNDQREFSADTKDFSAKLKDFAFNDKKAISSKDDKIIITDVKDFSSDVKDFGTGVAEFSFDKQEVKGFTFNEIKDFSADAKDFSAQAKSFTFKEHRDINTGLKDFAKVDAKGFLFDNIKDFSAELKGVKSDAKDLSKDKAIVFLKGGEFATFHPVSLREQDTADFPFAFGSDNRSIYYTEYSDSQGVIAGKRYQFTKAIKELVIYSKDQEVKASVDSGEIVRILAKAEAGETLWVFVGTSYHPGSVYAKTYYYGYGATEKLREFNAFAGDAYKMYYVKNYGDNLLDLGYADYAKLAGNNGEITITVKKGGEPRSLKTIQTITLSYK